MAETLEQFLKRVAPKRTNHAAIAASRRILESPVPAEPPGVAQEKTA